MPVLYVSTCIAGSCVLLWKWQPFPYGRISQYSQEYYRKIWPEQ